MPVETFFHKIVMIRNNLRPNELEQRNHLRLCANYNFDGDGERCRGKTEIYTVVGVDELDFAPNAVSWISQIGKALLASELGDRITLEDGR